MSTLHHSDFSTLHQLQAFDAAHHVDMPVLNYHTTTGLAEDFIPKTLGGFALGAMVMGLMLSFAAVAIRRMFHDVPHAELEFAVRSAFLFGLSFAGASLLLVALKAREERHMTELHTRHWLVSLASGAGYALAVFGPGLAAETAFPVNRYATLAVWALVLVYPIIASFWMLTTKAPVRVSGVTLEA